MAFYSEDKKEIVRFIRTDIDESLLQSKRNLIEQALKLGKKKGKKQADIKNPKLRSLLEEVNNPLFEYIYMSIGIKGITHLILTYCNEWCFRCHTMGRLKFHLFEGCGSNIKIYYPQNQLLIRSDYRIDGDVKDIKVMNKIMKNSLPRSYYKYTWTYAHTIYNPDKIHFGFSFWERRHIIYPGTKLIFWGGCIYINRFEDSNPLPIFENN